MIKRWKEGPLQSLKTVVARFNIIWDLERKEKQPNSVLVSQWKVLPKENQFTPLKEGSKKPGVLPSAPPLIEEIQGWPPLTPGELGVKATLPSSVCSKGWSETPCWINNFLVLY